VRGDGRPHALVRPGPACRLVGDRRRNQTESDAKVRTIKSAVSFSYKGPTTLAWRQEKGELKSVDGRWVLEDLGGNRTRATYWLEVDLGRMLSLVIRGPLVDLVREILVSTRAGKLKRAIESG
jgi:hypothetical protein